MLFVAHTYYSPAQCVPTAAPTDGGICIIITGCTPKLSMSNCQIANSLVRVLNLHRVTTTAMYCAQKGLYLKTWINLVLSPFSDQSHHLTVAQTSVCLSARLHFTELPFPSFCLNRLHLSFSCRNYQFWLVQCSWGIQLQCIKVCSFLT